MTARDVISQALALSEAATDGPWRADDEHGLMPGATPAWCVSRTNEAEAFLGDIAYSPQGHPQEQENAEFTAAARTLLPAFAKALGDVLATVEAHGEWARFESADPGVDSWAIPTHLIQGAITAALSEVTP